MRLTTCEIRIKSLVTLDLLGHATHTNSFDHELKQVMTNI